MATKADLLAEAYRRGLLPPDKRAAYEEAQRRGLLGASHGERKRSVAENVTGFMANVNRGLGIGDELAAGAQTAVNVFAGRTPITEVGADFRRSMAQQRQVEDQFAAERPRTAALARGTGMAATAAVPVGNTANLFAQGSRAVNAARGATVAGLEGAAYAAADRGTAGERLAAASRTARDPLTLALGAGAGSLATARRAPRPKPQARSNAQILAERGISTTPAQRAGSTVKAVEDLGKRAPILGPAMSGYQNRQIEQLNRAVGLEALKPVGKGIPKSVKPGFEMVQYVDDQLGDVYNQAAKMAPVVRLDDQLISDAQAIGARRADLAESEARLFDSIVGDRLQRLNSGEASGEMVKKIHSELGGLQAEAAKRGQDTLASMLGETRRAIMGLVERANPEAGALIRKADEGWRIYSMMNDAAAQASGRGGVFLPGQFNTQVRRAGKAIGSNMAGKGQGPLQELSTAAMEMIPDSYGNPGTANALGLGAGGVGLLTDPATTLTAGTALTAAATPYFLAGRRVLEALPDTATRQQLLEAERQLAELAAKDPAVAALRRQVAARLSRAAGVAGAAPEPAAQRNIFAEP